jgi:response regulator RpfG family c-di-GMP phosphodiesterase
MSRKKKILLVDDSRTSLFMEQMILKKEPYDIITRRRWPRGRREGGEGASGSHPDGRRDAAHDRLRSPAGAARPREHSRHPHHHGHDARRGPERRDRLPERCTDYVTKPIDPVLLLGKVRSHLGEGEAPQ